MVKEVVKLDQKTIKQGKEYSLEKIRKLLSANNACYVLITCDAPKIDGKIHVEMSYEGDEVLASYLLENAQHVLDEQVESSQSSESFSV